MKIDRLILDAFDWIRRIIWWRKGKIKTPVYTVLETRQGKYAIVRRVTRDSERAVDTWICTPYRTKAQKIEKVPVRDIHLLLDHLGAIAGSPGQRRTQRSINTHRIQVIQAARFLEPDDTFEGETLYQGDYDLQGDQPRRDFYALLILRDLVRYVLLQRKMVRVNWEKEIAIAGKAIMGSQWKGAAGTRIDKVTGIIIDRKPR